MLKKVLLILLVAIAAWSVHAATAVVDARPTQIDISSATSESAVLVTVSGYTSDDARYRLYNGSNQYNCWDNATSAYITSTSYSAGPQVPGTPTTSSTWWIPFQRGNNATTAASYRDRLGTAYSANYMTAALPTATAISTPVSITNSNVTFPNWNTYTAKYVILAFDATTGGTLISASSSALTTGAFDLKIETGTTIRRIEVRDLLNNTIDSVTGTWPTVGTPTIAVTGTLNPFTTYTGTASASQSYTLTGTNLTAPIALAAPAGFEISTNGGTSYAGTGSVAANFNGLIYVRLTGTTAGTYGGNITHTSTGATQVDLAASGEVFAPAVPTLFIEENFAYTTGVALTTVGWTAHSTGINPILVSDTGLTYTNYPPIQNYSATMATSGEDINRTFSAQALGNVYSSLLINVSSAQTTGDYFYHLSSSPLNTQHYRGRVYIQKDTASENFRIGIANGGAVGTAVWTGYNYVYGQTYLILLKYETVPGANNDLVHLWVNPDFTGAEPAPLLTATDAITSEPANIGAVILRQGISSAAAALKVDGIRVSNDWAKLWAPAATPVISATGTPDPLASIVGNPSEEVSSYTLSGTNMLGPINIAAPAHFEVSTSSTEGWASTLQVPADFNGLIYVRLNSSVVGPHDGFVTHNSTNAAEVTVLVEGETFAADVTWNVTGTLTPFTQTVGTPSANQSYTLSATNATGDITVSVGTPFELSTTGTGGWSTSLTLAANFNSYIYVRLNSATAGGPFSGTIVHVTANATDYELAVSGTTNPPAGNYATDLFFSEYLEGSSNNKALEIFNGTGAPVDLSAYKVYLYSNGNPTPGSTLTFTAGTILANNDVYVIANASANAAILAQSDVTSTVTYFNGDDAVALVKVVDSIDTFVDIFGVIDQDPGTRWTAADGYQTDDRTLVRKSTVTGGVTVNPINNGDGITTDFVTLGTEWDIYPVDTTDYLGAHTFTPGAQIAEAPVLNPASGVFSSPISVTMSTTTPGATIYYTRDGSIPSNTNGFNYSVTGPAAVSATTTIKAITYAPGYSPSSVTIENYMFPTLIPNIATLRAQTADGQTVYKLTGEAVLTFQQATRHQKYIQDATAAILIDDPSVPANISTTYNLYDGITGITGTLFPYNQMLQFTPVADPGPATSTGNVIVPEVRTLASITSADQAKLIKVMNVTVDATLVNYPAAAANINVTDPSGTLVMRTFPTTDYSGTPILTPVNITCLAGQYLTAMQISPRFLADLEDASVPLGTPVVSIAYAAGSVTLTWGDVDGASSYRVETASNPYGTYTPVVPDVTEPTYVITNPTEAMKFFRVIAIP